MRSPILYIGLGVLGTWAFHHFVKPLPAAKTA